MITQCQNGECSTKGIWKHACSDKVIDQGARDNDHVDTKKIQIIKSQEEEYLDPNREKIFLEESIPFSNLSRIGIRVFEF